MRVVQVNSAYGGGSTGRITELLHNMVKRDGGESRVLYGRGKSGSGSDLVKIGSYLSMLSHVAESRLADRHGLGSRRATKNAISLIDAFQPDVVSLHNIHGYYINYPILFRYLAEAGLPVVWTLHDCWAFTGHCSNFDRFDCKKWQTLCESCPMTGRYPKSLVDRSSRNFQLKRHHFNAIKDLTIVTPSVWLKNLVGRSFLSGHTVKVIHNGADLEKFSPCRERDVEPLVLGVANIWNDRKGLGDFVRLREILPKVCRIVLIGLSGAQASRMPTGIECISRTESEAELAAWYSRASVFVNPTYSDNFPTTNIEALACGTPVVTYDTGGSPEALDENCGRVIPRGDIEGLAKAILSVLAGDSSKYRHACRSRAESHFCARRRFADHLALYESVIEAIR